MHELESNAPQTKRLVIWVIACLLVFVGWGYIAPRPVRPPVDAAKAPAEAPAPATPAPGDGTTAGASDPALTADAAPPQASAPVVIEETAPRRVLGRTPHWSVEVSNVGGRITSWKLLDEGDHGDPTRPLEIVRRILPPPAPGAPPVDGGAVEALDDQAMLPLQVLTGDAELDLRLARALHSVSVESLAGRQSIVARWSDGAGTSIEKILTLHEDRPLATIEARLTVEGRPASFRLGWGPGIGNHTPEQQTNFYFNRGNIAVLGDEKVEVIPRPSKQDDLASRPLRWAAIQDSYFTVLFSPLPVRGDAADARPASGARAGFQVGGETPVKDNGKEDKARWPEALVLEVPFTPESPVQAIHAGPRDRRVLQQLDASFTETPRLAQLTHLGMLDGLARLLHAGMLKFHAWTGSWGWSVVLLTLLVRIVIAPLQFFSMKKMRGMADKMRPMQAKLKAIDERYKKQPPTRENRMKQMQEKQELMLEAGINPAEGLSGCIPLLITMPVFFALLKLLPNAPEFRHEAFLLWSDLSAADPSRVLPIAAAVLTLVSTKMSMSSSGQSIDPMQRNMLYMFPLMLVWLCWTAPLAFVVYQVAMSAIQIGQQQLFNMALPPVGSAPDDARTKPGKARNATAETIAAAPAGPAQGSAGARKKGRKR